MRGGSDSHPAYAAFKVSEQKSGGSVPGARFKKFKRAVREGRGPQQAAGWPAGEMQLCVLLPPTAAALVTDANVGYSNLCLTNYQLWSWGWCITLGKETLGKRLQWQLEYAPGAVLAPGIYRRYSMTNLINLVWRRWQGCTIVYLPLTNNMPRMLLVL